MFPLNYKLLLLSNFDTKSEARNGRTDRRGATLNAARWIGRLLMELT